METIRLLDDERGGMILAASVNTISFFSGSVQAMSVQAKVESILSANQWLSSRLVKSLELGEVVAQYRTCRTANISDHFQAVTNHCLSSCLNYSCLIENVAHVLVPVGALCVDKDVSLFKVTLIEIRPDEEYALVVSLSHTIGDGHTFYQLYSMLDADTPTIPLSCERHFDFTQKLVDAAGSEVLDWIVTPQFSQGISHTINSGVVPSVCGFTLDKKAIEERKAASSIDSFITTNDIVVSWFCGLCGPTAGLLVMNLRGRLEGLRNSVAGNYHTLLVYGREGYGSAESIRKSIAGFNRGGFIPSPEQTLDSHIAMVTNWSSFYRDISLGSESRFTKHFPLMNPRELNFRDTCIVFSLNSDTRAVMLFTRSPVDIAQMCSNRDAAVRLLDSRIM